MVEMQRPSEDLKLFSVYVPTNHVYIGDVFLLHDADIIRTNISVREGIGELPEPLFTDTGLHSDILTASAPWSPPRTSPREGTSRHALLTGRSDKIHTHFVTPLHICHLKGITPCRPLIPLLPTPWETSVISCSLLHSFLLSVAKEPSLVPSLRQG